MNNIFYLLATHGIALAFWASALAKIIQPSEDSHYENIFRRIAASRYFNWAEILMAALIISPIPSWLHGVFATALGIIVALGAFYRLNYPEEECECFGSITPISTSKFVALSVLLLGLISFVVVTASQQPRAIVPFNLFVFVGAVLLAALIERKLRYDDLSGSGYAGKNVGIEELKDIPRLMELGIEGGRTFTAGDLTDNDRPILILGISTRCRICRETFERLRQSREILASEFEIVVVAEGSGLFSKENVPGFLQLVDSKSRVGRFLGIRARPFAIYLSNQLELQLPPVGGVTNVNNLLSLLENLVVEKHTRFPMDGV